MKLSSLLEKLEYTCVQGSTEQEVTGVVYDSRKVTDGSLFICIRGAVVDGHKFIPDVTAKGAKVLVVEEEVSAPTPDMLWHLFQQPGSDIRQRS